MENVKTDRLVNQLDIKKYLLERYGFDNVDIYVFNYIVVIIRNIPFNFYKDHDVLKVEIFNCLKNYFLLDILYNDVNLYYII